MELEFAAGVSLYGFFGVRDCRGDGSGDWRERPSSDFPIRFHAGGADEHRGYNPPLRKLIFHEKYI